MLLEDRLSDEKVLESIGSFTGIEHRIEFVLRFKKISFFNDSKATNPDSASKSISALRNIFLIAGGILKTDDISPIKPYINNICGAYFYGKDAERIQESFVNLLKSEIFHNIDCAFEKAVKDAIIFDCESNVLLAPMCSSFDQFKNFEERGLYFKDLVKGFAKQNL